MRRTVSCCGWATSAAGVRRESCIDNDASEACDNGSGIVATGETLRGGVGRSTLVRRSVSLQEPPQPSGLDSVTLAGVARPESAAPVQQDADTGSSSV